MSLVTQEKSLDGESESLEMTPLSAELSDRGVLKQDNLRFYRWWPCSPEAVDGVALWPDLVTEVVRTPMFTIKANLDAGGAYHWFAGPDFQYCDVCWIKEEMPFHVAEICGSKEPILWGFQ